MLSSLGSINTINKFSKQAPVLPPIIQSMTNVYPQNPFLYFSGDSGTIIRNASNNVISFRQTISNQISPYTFKNGLYYFKVSEQTSSTNVGIANWNLFTNLCGDINGVADTPYTSPAVYLNNGNYNGSNSTISSGNTINGEWIQFQLPYKLYLTNYQIHTNASSAGAAWNNFFTKSFYLCGSNDGVNWTTLDSKSNISTNSNGFNYFTVSNIVVGYSYFRLIGTQVGTLTTAPYGNRMSVMVGLGGTYRG